MAISFHTVVLVVGEVWPSAAWRVVSGVDLQGESYGAGDGGDDDDDEWES